MSHVTTTSCDALAIPQSRTVVAVVVEWRGKIALFKRSQRVHYDQGLWHCVTGFLEEGASPRQQAADELLDETGLQAKDLLDFHQGPDVIVNDNRDLPWLIHTFKAVSSRRRLKIDWEHDAYRWTPVGKTKRFTNKVPWLESVLRTTGYVTDSPYPASDHL
jgi:ADP-ribose pyrophosphatase YjhB (NUDIX family)